MRRFIIIVCALLACVGCTRLTDAQALQLSQARADATAAQSTSDGAARATLYQAAGCRLLAGLNDAELPPPIVAPSMLVNGSDMPIAAAVEQESHDAKAAQDDPPSGWVAVAAGIAGGLGLTALSILRFSPGAFGVVADLAHAWLAPKATKDMRAVQIQAVDVAREAVAYGQQVTAMATAAGLGERVEDIKSQAARIQNQLGLREPIQALLASVKNPDASPTGKPS